MVLQPFKDFTVGSDGWGMNLQLEAVPYHGFTYRSEETACHHRKYAASGARWRRLVHLQRGFFMASRIMTKDGDFSAVLSLEPCGI